MLMAFAILVGRLE
jgi:hypothetical protein